MVKKKAARKKRPRRKVRGAEPIKIGSEAFNELVHQISVQLEDFVEDEVAFQSERIKGYLREDVRAISLDVYERIIEEALAEHLEVEVRFRKEIRDRLVRDREEGHGAPFPQEAGDVNETGTQEGEPRDQEVSSAYRGGDEGAASGDTGSRES